MSYNTTNRGYLSQVDTPSRVFAPRVAHAVLRVASPLLATHGSSKDSVRGSGAPMRTHCSKSATTSGGSALPGGIFRLGSLYRKALISKLASGSPGGRSEGQNCRLCEADRGCRVAIHLGS